MVYRDTRPKPNMKPPKRRFQIGDKFLDVREGERYEVIGCYRLRENVHEWIWQLRSLEPLLKQSVEMLMVDVIADQKASDVVRLVVEPFRTDMDAASYFMQIPPKPGFRGNFASVPNKTLLDPSRWRKIS